MNKNRRDALISLIAKGIQDGDSLTLSRHKALRATNSTIRDSEEITKDPEFQQIRALYLRQHTKNRQWVK